MTTTVNIADNQATSRAIANVVADNQANAVADNQANAVVDNQANAVADNQANDNPTPKPLSPVALSLERKAKALQELEISKNDLDTDLINSFGAKFELNKAYTIPQLIAVENAWDYDVATLQVKSGNALVRVRIVGETQPLGGDLPGSVFVDGFVLASVKDNLYLVVGKIHKGKVKFLSQKAIDDLTKPTAKYMAANQLETVKALKDSLSARQQANDLKTKQALEAYGG